MEKKSGDIFNVILNENIYCINILDKDSKEYIFFSDVDINDDYKINLIEAKNNIPNEQEKEMYEEIIEDLCYDE